jgi:hypothetical protein
MREFTWWRRFHGAMKLPKKYLYKGASELLQRIEFGEYEFDHLGREIYLEDLIYQQKLEQTLQESPWLKGETLDDRMSHERKLYNKRKSATMKKHLENEQKLLWKLTEDLSREFDLTKEFISNEMETFDGTTRELYYYIKSIKLGRHFDPERQQRFIREQPRHILKPKERKYADLWIKLVNDRGWQRFLNWE